MSCLHELAARFTALSFKRLCPNLEKGLKNDTKHAFWHSL